MEAFVTYDIDENDDYEECHRTLLDVFSLAPVSKNKKLPLPESTLAGWA